MRLRTTLFVFVVATGILLFADSPAALGQADYAGIPPPPPPADLYVGAYVGAPPGSQAPGGGPLTASAPPGVAGGQGSVVNTALEDPLPVPDADGRLVTGSDLATIAALGLAAAVGFAVLAGRFRSI